MFETIEFYAGKELDFSSLEKKLDAFGYRRQAQVGSNGEFSVRGGVIDIFPLHFSLPIRIELQHEMIETIHTFDPATGRRLEPHHMVLVLPMTSHASSKGRRQSAERRELSARVLDTDFAAPVDPFVDVAAGDLVVHTLHGIAVYRGVKALKNKGGSRTDHFVLEFEDKNILYVPTRDLHLLQRYVAFGKTQPRLSKLGSKQWERLKEKTLKGVVSFASELLHVQAKRKALRGFISKKDNDWQKQLEAEFPYEETEDQRKAAADVKRDMEAPTPMDRLLCGDVGYGKTEVALRAAFKTVMNGKQVAMLVPTTILAEQHFHTFSSRMKNFPVRVAMLSRFQSPGQQKAIVKELALGQCDIVIGTHRLLSRDVRFKNLGLVIVDEEQRFGVRHKEHLKKLRLLVDVLTLTATPIPRTLYLSLVGAKDMSTINTPPRNRKPIKTIVAETSEALVREAIDRELRRHGQVFYIHNRVEGIGKVLERVQKMVPRARVALTHGQVPSKALESVMKRFIEGEVDVLVSTTIVESGIDIPNANTLIVDRADRFGLSELYQLRGRVGRFDVEAYAYFLVPKGMVLTAESNRRLEAIERFSYLGSGFNLAMEDLEIRGAGNILGTEQHGYITQVGFDLYCRMLKEAVRQAKRVESPDLSVV